MELYPILRDLHWFTRWLLPIALLVAVYFNFKKPNGIDKYSKIEWQSTLYAMMFAHLQLLMGILLLFMSPIVSAFWASPGEYMGDRVMRYWGMEHIITNLIAVIVITIGYSKAKRATDFAKKRKSVIIFYLIGFVLIFQSVFFAVGRGAFDK